MNTEEKDTTQFNENLEQEIPATEPIIETKVVMPEEQNETTEVDNPEKLKANLAEYKDKYLRLYADFENFRKRNSKEKADLIKYAGEETIKSMLTVLDDFERALKSMENATEVAPIKEGVQLVFQKFQRLLEQNGLKVVSTAQGDAFDLEKHESITQIPAPSEELKGKVIDVIEKGYTLQDKIIRFAKVVIGS